MEKREEEIKYMEGAGESAQKRASSDKGNSGRRGFDDDEDDLEY